ncbi:MAG: hypothetical protein ABI583_07890 [Betaproteobacteria bacterium]
MSTLSALYYVWQLERKMVWVFAQVFLALALAVFIVWWTFPKSKKAEPSDNAAPKSDDEHKN